MATAYHSQYWAHALSLQGSGGNIESLSRSIANARVDLNPHQIDAALFALRSPLSNGGIFADEVGLGKTIEAGIVLAQRWAERRRQILIIVPAMIRKQWQQELEQKFYLPCVILDTKIFNHLVRDGSVNPFNQDHRVVICSYHFASAKSAEISRVPWDLAVIDEAHRLRNVYRSRNRTGPLARKSMAHKIADALEQVPKLNSHLIGQLLLLHRRIRDRDGLLRLCGLSEYNQRVLKMHGLLDRFPAYDSLEEAVLGASPTKPR